MTLPEMTKEYDQLVHRTIPADHAAEMKWARKLYGAEEKHDARLEAQLRRCLQQAMRKTDLACKQAVTLHRALTAKGLRVPPVPHPHHPDL